MRGPALPVQPRGASSGGAAPLADLADVSDVRAIGLELIERCDAVDRLLERVLEAQDSPEPRREPEAAQLAGVVAALGAGVLMLAADGSVARCNRAAAGLLGRSEDELVGSPVPEIVASVPPGSEGEVAFDEGGERRVLLVARRTVQEGGEVVLLTDVTARRAEDERHRIDRLDEVLATLAVLSHKINNPLTALIGRAQILQARQGTDPHVVKAATVIEESAQHIAELVRELAKVVKSGRVDASRGRS
jgi:signal transduction histidine kinase